MASPEKTASLDELNEVFSMMWEDALALLTDLTRGINLFGYAAYLHFVIAAMLLMVAWVFLASGNAATWDIVYFVMSFGTACIMLFIGWRLLRSFRFLRSKYSRMIAAAKKFKQVVQT